MSEVIKADGGGLRANEGKILLDLVPPEALWAMGRVLQFGAKKYAKHNWLRGMPWSEVEASLLRHLMKWARGEDKDEESGCTHLEHVLTNAAFLVVYEALKLGKDDRAIVVRPEEK